MSTNEFSWFLTVLAVILTFGLGGALIALPRSWFGLSLKQIALIPAVGVGALMLRGYFFIAGENEQLRACVQRNSQLPYSQWEKCSIVDTSTVLQVAAFIVAGGILIGILFGSVLLLLRGAVWLLHWAQRRWPDHTPPRKA